MGVDFLNNEFQIVGHCSASSHDLRLRNEASGFGADPVNVAGNESDSKTGSIAVESVSEQKIVDDISKIINKYCFIMFL